MLRIGAINVRGIQFNTPYLNKLLDVVDVCCTSEHWLHSYELDTLHSLHHDFTAWGLAPPDEEDTVHCVPRCRKGHGGVAILWRKSLRNVSKLPQLSHYRCIGINIADRLSIFSSYLPSRSGCTDAFKESLDLLQMIRDKLDSSTMVIFAGDLNADLGMKGGPCATTVVNEQGQILARYLETWG